MPVLCYMDPLSVQAEPLYLEFYSLLYLEIFSLLFLKVYSDFKFNLWYSKVVTCET